MKLLLTVIYAALLTTAHGVKYCVGEKPRCIIFGENRFDCENAGCSFEDGENGGCSSPRLYENGDYYYPVTATCDSFSLNECESVGCTVFDTDALTTADRAIISLAAIGVVLLILLTFIHVHQLMTKVQASK